MRQEFLRVFKALAVEHRLRILELLMDGEKCACKLQAELKLSQPTFSHHMKILCDSGLVRCFRVGKWYHYEINAKGCDYGKALLDTLAEGDGTAAGAGIAKAVLRVTKLRRKLGAIPKNAIDLRTYKVS